MSEVNVKTIVRDYLKANGYDGLCTYQCGCSVDALALCGDFQWSCKPAYKVSDGCKVAERQGIECYSEDGCCLAEDGEGCCV